MTAAPRTSHHIIFGDARNMRQIAERTAHLVITSPPYWQLKDYGSDMQIGFNDSYEEYINHLALVWAECNRVLDDGCRLCINIGDQFARAVYYGRYKVISIKTEIIKCCEALGLDYMGAIIWQKPTTANASGGGTVMGSYPHPRNGVIKIDYEFILIFKKPGTPKQKIDAAVKAQSQLSSAEWNLFFAGHWHFCGERQDKHLAMFPLELPRRLIKMFSFVGDTVLDPFLGSGTTALAAAQLRRNSLGYEINPSFKKTIKQKLAAAPALLSGAPCLHFIEEPEKINKARLRHKIAALPYSFKDRAPLKRKIDPKKFHFGSKLDSAGNGQKQDVFFTVSKVLNPHMILLSNGATVRLLGITPLPQKAPEAVSFIRNKTGGKKVYVRFDNPMHDQAGNLLGYLYLSNKTFINAHLIKHGFAIADREVSHRHLARFIKYQEARHGA